MIAVSYRLFDGNINDFLTLQSNIEALKDDFKIKDIVVVADNGIKEVIKE
jgi:transposase